MDAITEGQLGQMYRVLCNDDHLESDVAADLIDALTEDVARDPEHAQALVWDQVDVQNIERYLFRDCCYRAFQEACAQVRRGNRAWIMMVFQHIEYERNGYQWAKLAEFCRDNGLDALGMVERWTNRPAVVADVSVAA